MYRQSQMWHRLQGIIWKKNKFWRLIYIEQNPWSEYEQFWNIFSINVKCIEKADDYLAMFIYCD